MKMYKTYLVTILCLFLTIAGCNEKNLDVDPVNEYLSENFYKTEEQMFSALVAAYDPVGWSMAYGQWVSYVMFADIRSDNANAGGDTSDNDQPGWQELDDFRETNSNVVLQPLYRKNYIGIFRANLVINNAQVESPLVDQYIAEAKFLRAFYHFELFKHFGPIPVVTSVLTPDDVSIPRSNMTQVFEAITTDLKDAINVLPSSISSSEAGRATLGAANALLGKVYLYWADLANDDQATFDLAAQHLREVVNSGQYVLEDDFNSLFSFGVENAAESVFEIQHTNLWSSDWGWFEGIEGNGVVQLCGIRGLCGDHPDYQEGWGFMLPTSSLYDHYLSDDTYRRESTIISEAQLAQDLAEDGITSCGSTVVDGTQQNPVDYTGYWQRKYANYKGYLGNNVNGGDPNLTKDPNTYYIRYADVLLMLAEALHRGSGADGEAMGYIDQVRERAAGPGDNTGNFRTAQDLMTQQGMSLLDVIWYERRAEFALEGDRWYDLVRSGRAAGSLFDDPVKSGNFNSASVWVPISLEETSVATGLTTYPTEADMQ